MALTATVGKVLTKVFGSRNERLLKRYLKIVAQINAMELEVQKLTDPQLKARTHELRTGLMAGKLRSAEVLPEAFAIIRESMDRNIGIRTIFNPVQDEMAAKFDPDRLDDHLLEVYDSVQRSRAVPRIAPPLPGAMLRRAAHRRMVLYEGRIAEMATGEGKTFVAPLACFMKNARGIHAMS
jgi:preprotein translocase subunit SecA